ncbi:MAG: hypothetical protein M1319_03770 [Chloroflexi bacterium]|nr:hypothetical protein [Chloroflexota bacterium]
MRLVSLPEGVLEFSPDGGIMLEFAQRTGEVDLREALAEYHDKRILISIKVDDSMMAHVPVTTVHAN